MRAPIADARSVFFLVIMRVGTLPLNAQAAVAAALLSVSLTMAPPALADVDYQGSKIGQDKQIESAKGYADYIEGLGLSEAEMALVQEDKHPVYFKM